MQVIQPGQENEAVLALRLKQSGSSIEKDPGTQPQDQSLSSDSEPGMTALTHYYGDRRQTMGAQEEAEGMPEASRSENEDQGQDHQAEMQQPVSCEEEVGGAVSQANESAAGRQALESESKDHDTKNLTREDAERETC